MRGIYFSMVVICLVPLWSFQVLASSFDAKKNLRNTVTITWEVVSDINKACASEYAKYGAKLNHKVDACAVWKGRTCRILTKRRPTEADVGHEVMHCFQEHFHD
jgi:hypothetical protein